jgi:hypothetical protein
MIDADLGRVQEDGVETPPLNYVFGDVAEVVVL